MEGGSTFKFGIFIVALPDYVTTISNLPPSAECCSIITSFDFSPSAAYHRETCKKCSIRPAGPHAGCQDLNAAQFYCLNLRAKTDILSVENVYRDQLSNFQVIRVAAVASLSLYLHYMAS
jgi:hypothetical protein